MSDNKIPFNIVLPIFICFALIGLYWLNRLNIDASTAYMWLFIIGIIFIAIAIIANRLGVDFWFEIPINRTSERAILMLFLGMFSFVILFFISAISKVAIYDPLYMQPLVQFSAGIGLPTFSALQAATSPFWSFFVSIISASVVEEIVLGFGFVIIGSLVLGYGLRKLLKLDFGDNNEYWDFAMSMIFSIIMFTVLHSFNHTYVNQMTGVWDWSMFTYAALFRLVLNMLIYKFGNFGLCYSIGVHAINNATYLGAQSVKAALFTFPGGIIICSIMILFIIFSFLSIKKIMDEGYGAWKDFLTFD